MWFVLKVIWGRGKTTLSAYLIQAIAGNPQLQVLSPTFSLVHLYDTTRGSIWHFDLYRLKSADELENIGFFDALRYGVTIIEWPEIAMQYLPAEAMWLEISQGASDLLRNLKVTNKMTTL
jgi:tRNA threonylcarbamoyl adenosine modification protein YjeE